MIPRQLAALGLLAIVTACSGPPAFEVTDEELRPVVLTWVNQTGLVRNDTGVWRVRLGEACAQGVWEEDVAVRLADLYVDQDVELAMEGVEDGPELRNRAAEALWIMSVQVCGDDFPEGEIEEGPPRR